MACSRLRRSVTVVRSASARSASVAPRCSTAATPSTARCSAIRSLTTLRPKAVRVRSCGQVRSLPIRKASRFSVPLRPSRSASYRSRWSLMNRYIIERTSSASTSSRSATTLARIACEPRVEPVERRGDELGHERRRHLVEVAERHLGLDPDVHRLDVMRRAPFADPLPGLVALPLGHPHPVLPVAPLPRVRRHAQLVDEGVRVEVVDRVPVHAVARHRRGVAEDLALVHAAHDEVGDLAAEPVGGGDDDVVVGRGRHRLADRDEPLDGARHRRACPRPSPAPRRGPRRGRGGEGRRRRGRTRRARRRCAAGTTRPCASRASATLISSTVPSVTARVMRMRESLAPRPARRTVTRGSSSR